MADQTEWEVVDAPPQDNRQTPQQMLKHLLGPWWRWKIAAAVIVLGVAMVFFLSVAAVFVIGLVTAAIISIGVARVRLWMRRRPGTTLRRK